MIQIYILINKNWNIFQYDNRIIFILGNIEKL